VKKRTKNETLITLAQASLSVRAYAYSPYSGHKVGAALRTTDGLIFSGCNVENSSYGATVCAERVAIQTAVAQGALNEKNRIEEIVVSTSASPPWPPCGMCRQVISEFQTPNLLIHAVNPSGEIVTWRFSDLLPEAFLPEHLAEKPPVSSISRRGRKNSKSSA
jgi:cytidine deaminase